MCVYVCVCACQRKGGEGGRGGEGEEKMGRRVKEKEGGEKSMERGEEGKGRGMRDTISHYIVSTME